MTPQPMTPGLTLAELLAGLPFDGELPRLAVTGLSLDSRELAPGDLFLALPGRAGHGLEHAAAAHAAGAAALLWEPAAGWDRKRVAALGLPLPLIALPGLGRHAGEIAARFHGRPSERLSVVGVTGTNGKSSVTHFLAQVRHPVERCGVIGTLGSGFPDALRAASHTTPDAVRVQARLAELRGAGARAVAMEVSSHALDQERVDAVRFDGAVLTNLGRDHLDYHGDLDAYAAAKRRLFERRELRFAVLNYDDPFGRSLLHVVGERVRSVVYSLASMGLPPMRSWGWIWAERIDAHAGGMRIELDGRWGRALLETGLIGRFNAANLLAALAVLLAEGWPIGEAIARLGRVEPPPGRLERIAVRDRAPVVIDYAHTPDALEAALAALAPHVDGRLWCLFGCGGDRDRGKRPEMGRIAERFADRVILTDDNPRSEDGASIIAQILAGISDPGAVEVERDRRRAIARALVESGPGDLILVAGKGHEEYQEIAGVRHPYSDRATVAELLGGGRP